MKNDEALRAASCLAGSIHFMKSPIISYALEDYARKEELLREIVIVSGKSFTEVSEFYLNHNFSLETILRALAAGATLEEKSILYYG